MPRRICTLLAAVAGLACVGALSACDSKVGTAATVDGDRISQSDVAHYLLPGATPSVDPASGTQASARTIVLNVLIQDKLFQRAAQEIGNVPGDAALSALKDTALGTGTTGATTEDKLRAEAATYGLSAAFVTEFLRAREYNAYLSQAVGSSTADQNRIRSLFGSIPIWVNGRYGSWSNENFQLVDSPLPAFLTDPHATPSATAGSPAS